MSDAQPTPSRGASETERAYCRGVSLANSSCAWRIPNLAHYPALGPPSNGRRATPVTGARIGAMRALFTLLAAVLNATVRLLRPGGVRGLVAENLLLKHYLVVQNRGRTRGR